MSPPRVPAAGPGEQSPRESAELNAEVITPGSGRYPSLLWDYDFGRRSKREVISTIHVALQTTMQELGREQAGQALGAAQMGGAVNFRTFWPMLPGAELRRRAVLGKRA
jgi:hypothetical protein